MRGLLSSIAVAALGCASSPPSHHLQTTSLAVEKKAPPSSSPESAADADVAGFVVHSYPAARKHPNREKLLAALAIHLADLVAAFPKGTQNELRETPIWLTERREGGPFFHPAAAERDLAFPEATNAIEIANIDDTLAKLVDGPRGVFAPLLAAGWLMRRHPEKLADADRALANAKAKSLTTARFGGDGLAWFATFSAAWFGRSNLPPDRGALRAADPEGAAFVAKTWPRDELPSRPTPAESESRTMHGFTVLIEKRALEHAETKKALAALDAKLGEIATLLPASAMKDVQSATVVVLRWADDMDTAWQLYTHDGMIDIFDVRTFLVSLDRDPYALVHEMAHVRRGKLDAERWSKVTAAFAAARAAHLYDAVKHADGRVGRAYAATDALEYFAELSKTYFAKGAWFPFTRAELEKHDPAGLRAVVDAWR